MNKTRLLVTGFAPFDDRTINSSWLAAKAVENSYSGIQLNTLELPVVWGEPARLLEPICEQKKLTIIISMGEGKPGWFEIETVARNFRKYRLDNNSEYPPSSKIKTNGPESHFSNAPCQVLQQTLAQRFPVKLSNDAGSFLCEETLYTLEELRLNISDLQMTLFVHLPPYDSVLIGGDTRCDKTVLSAFAHQLIDTTLGIINMN